ncbi:hypothetical protein [Methylomonas sp. DH-1]|uniref:hypothetical protein n=1 Tax=Methylomonas sp. (strain DH-1) TaxID=1727196 RepID=UPI000B23882F|nr:hypothetical protein [Methylomonas sp. DH-1]
MPELVFAIPFMCDFGKMQALQQALGLLPLEVVDDPAGGIRFEAGNAFVEFRGLGDKVQMVFQNHVAVARGVR